MAAMWTPRRRRKARRRRDWSFAEFTVTLFFFGLILELLYVFGPNSGAFGWLLILPGIAALVGLVLLMAREPANL